MLTVLTQKPQQAKQQRGGRAIEIPGVASSVGQRCHGARATQSSTEGRSR
jgi:hypothetical protein